MNRAGHIAFQIAATLLAGVAMPSSPPPSFPVASASASASSSSAESVSPVLRQALERALSAPGARLDSAVEEHGAARSNDCRALSAEAARAVSGSGRVALKVSGRSVHGQPCERWTWVRIRVVAPVTVAVRALREGERFDGAVVTEERELRIGHEPGVIGPGSVALRAVAAGHMIESSQVSQPTLRAGEAVKVLVISGAVVIEQSGRAVPCARGRSCATLASGKRVEGDLVDGQLVVQSP